MSASTPDLIRSKLYVLLSNMLESKGITFRAEELLRRQLDSLDMVVLFAEVESTFGVSLDEFDEVDSSFRTIDTLAQFVTRKQSASAPDSPR